MKHKIIDGVNCVSRDVIYSDFGATTEAEVNRLIQESSEEFRSKEARAAALEDRVYSWEDIEDSDPDLTEEMTNQYGEHEDRLFSELGGTGAIDTEYSQLQTRIRRLKRPLHMQLKELHRDHSRFYKSRAGRMKPAEVDILIDDYRFELHRILAKGKDVVVATGGNLDTILKLSSITGGSELGKTARSLSILFRRVEKAYTRFGFIPREYQTQLNDAISILVSTLVMDVYGPEMERRRMEAAEGGNK